MIKPTVFGGDSLWLIENSRKLGDYRVVRFGSDVPLHVQKCIAINPDQNARNWKTIFCLPCDLQKWEPGRHKIAWAVICIEALQSMIQHEDYTRHKVNLGKLLLAAADLRCRRKAAQVREGM